MTPPALMRLPRPVRTVRGSERSGTGPAAATLADVFEPEIGGLLQLSVTVEFNRPRVHAVVEVEEEPENENAAKMPGNQLLIEPMTVRRIRDNTRAVLPIFLAR